MGGFLFYNWRNNEKPVAILNPCFFLDALYVCRFVAVLICRIVGILIYRFVFLSGLKVLVHTLAGLLIS